MRIRFPVPCSHSVYIRYIHYINIPIICQAQFHVITIIFLPIQKRLSDTADRKGAVMFLLRKKHTLQKREIFGGQLTVGVQITVLPCFKWLIGSNQPA